MTDINKDISLDTEGRQKDVQINLQARGHGSIQFDISRGGIPKQPYPGPYTIVSEKDILQIIPTENKLMKEDLVVLPIPYSETSNLKGGLTVCIGGE